MLNRRWILALGLSPMLLAAGLTTTAAAQEAPQPEPKRVIIRSVEEAQPGSYVPVQLKVPARIAFVADEAVEASPYWIGVQLEPLTDFIKSQLNLESGMIAVHVFDDSPAAKAGVRQHDIIIKAADKPIKEPTDLLKVVGEVKDKPLVVVVLRGGKENSIQVTPVKRPEPAGTAQEAEASQSEAIKKLEIAIKEYEARLHTAKEKAHALALMKVQPGIVMSRKSEIPKDVTIRITKEGATPAKISVKKDGKEWEVTEDKVGELPEEVRGYVQQLHSGPAMARAYSLRLPAAAGTPAIPALPGAPGVVAKPRAVEAYRGAYQPAPVAPPATGSEPTKVYRYRVETKHADGDNEDSKLDQILKILSHKEDSSVAELRKEVQSLRKELEELRKEKK